MSGTVATAVAVVFVWLGMVLAISFLETPLKFRAPDVTLRIGLGIGRLVFRALNGVECLLALALIVVAVVEPLPAWALAGGALAVGALLCQLLAVRPTLTRRANAVLAGQDAPRSRAHYAYVGLELVKVAALVLAGVQLLANAAQ